jgi:hypothetical protein
MANNLVFNPMRVDTATLAIWDPKGEIIIQALQWVDDNSSPGGRIEDGDDCVFTLNGVIIKLNCRAVASVAGSMAYNLSIPVPIRTFQLDVTKIDGGTLLIWKA